MPGSAGRSTGSGVVPWPRADADRYFAEGYWEGRSLGTQLAETARKYPDEVCLVDGDVRMTFGELLAKADGAAIRMSALGVGGDDRVVIQLPNCWEFVVTTVACLRLGAVPVWTMPQFREHEIGGILANAEASAIVVPDVHKGFDHQALAREVLPDGLVFVVGEDVAPGNVDLRGLFVADEPAEVTQALDAAAPNGDSVATFLLSGGTTGLPKLIPRSGNDLTYMIKTASEICRFGPGTSYLVVLPLGHGFANTGPGILGALLSGGRVVIAPSPAPQQALPLIESERITATSAVPAILHRWIEYLDTGPGIDLSTLEMIQIGAAKLDPSLAAQVRPKLGCTLQQVFGMGEGLLCLTRLDDPDELILHTQGKPISPHDEIRLVDEEGAPVPPGEPGILLVRGPYTTRGYYRSPELNARSFVEGGWYNTGDIVRVTPEGYLVVSGREKDVINRGGEKINAEEIESFALELAGVKHAAAVAMPDPELGEVVCLYVVATDSVALKDVHDLMLAAGAARFKLPERLVVVDALPATGIGKVDKKALRADIAERLKGPLAA
ncbi:(2,3-dihydroxybenzoyl)adenylate synthase [Amycolatopsis oliviviridis]|uniref:2,3-dihydroxybenzoate-AMP ligase n=1 Tax=Amycolatopsis oliviviridis TaxID=1471590 RepID=A0ABQ3LTP3_9PSEU|nr:AMP-binding protein [Amycolatopsis oliviviridis]GHH17903.1 2,3-dihydroxybenzoate-AMP ligase [Amycolatopsis oliviviridis]